VIDKLNEFSSNFKTDYEKLKRDKQNYTKTIEEYERKHITLSREIDLKNGDIERLKSMNNIMERENEILKLKIEN